MTTGSGLTKVEFSPVVHYSVELTPYYKNGSEKVVAAFSFC